MEVVVAVFGKGKTMNDLLDRAKEALKGATPGPWDKSKIGFVHKSGVLHPPAPDETRMPGESWIDMRNRIYPQIAAREFECRCNSEIRALAPDLARALIVAGELADAVEASGQYAGMDLARVSRTLFAFREALKGTDK